MNHPFIPVGKKTDRDFSNSNLIMMLPLQQPSTSMNFHAIRRFAVTAGQRVTKTNNGIRVWLHLPMILILVLAFQFRAGAQGNCTPPVFTTQPSTVGQTLCVNGTYTALTVATDAPTATYQWYRNTTNSASGGTLITGATSTTLTPTPASSTGGTVTLRLLPAMEHWSHQFFLLPQRIPLRRQPT